MASSSDEPAWKQLKLSLEAPCVDDEGQRIPRILDIQGDVPIFDEKQSAAERLRETIARMVHERGPDLSLITMESLQGDDPEAPAKDEAEKDAGKEDEEGTRKPMTVAQLSQMRTDTIQKLNIAAGEISQALEIVELLLSTKQSAASGITAATATTATAAAAEPPAPPIIPPSALTTTHITPAPPRSSIRARDAQLIVGTKDDTLRNAASIFSRAAQRIGRAVEDGEEYWRDAVRLRAGNWGMVPRPLPPSHIPVRKGTDNPARDFLVSFGLEEAPPIHRRRAIAFLTDNVTRAEKYERLTFPFRQKTRLRVGITHTDENGQSFRSYSTILSPASQSKKESLDVQLTTAQREITEQEVFSDLIKETGSLPSCAASVSEKSIIVEAVKNTQLSFEMVSTENAQQPESLPSSPQFRALCDLILPCLTLLLIRSHRSRKTAPQTGPQVAQTRRPRILAPVISMLQYYTFVTEMHAQVQNVHKGLAEAGIDVDVHWVGVGQSAEEVLKMFESVEGAMGLEIGGEAIIRIDKRRTIRFTFSSPTTVALHLQGAILAVTDVPQLRRLLLAQVTECVLELLKHAGTDRGGKWFIDNLEEKCVGIWEGGSLQTRLEFDESFHLTCIGVFASPHGPPKQVKYPSKGGHVSLTEWFQAFVQPSVSRA
ncbi:hypothetical protein BOTBODRAFT_34193 [Botryobasidium botryosum FD-172 SS1]|uniref:Mediator of RNA polymerase II transcription subunit 17 n=1 Tax=Botryobasidium botryosum (strain FD-172 SS1) TaxID=930990 RepID=A0A067MAE9_BOTB1|nr:hypothetical protein BOTBODRAFT_34193 [Botryobasidium botryosum FD-172 SS1]